jgi:hypothetical protein
MRAQGLDRVVAAAWLESAMATDHATKRQLVGSYCAGQDMAYGISRDRHETPSFASARRRSSISAVNGRARVVSRPIRTRSTPDTGCSRSKSLAASFSRRRVRLRITALPTFFVTVNPIRAAWPSSRGNACRTRPCTAALRPLEAARKNSARRFSRCGNGRNCNLVGSAGAIGITRNAGSGRKLCATLGAAIGENLAAANGRHAGAETVPVLADEFGRLIRTLHDGTPENNMMVCGKRLHTRNRARFPGPASSERLIGAACSPRQPKRGLFAGAVHVFAARIAA